MKKILLYLLLAAPTIVFAQKPAWISDAERSATYPKTQHLTGFAINVGRETPNFVKTLKNSAKTELIEGIRVSVQSAKQLSVSENRGVVSEDYTSTTVTFAEAEINGLKIEYYYDNAENTGYAFAHANKSEVRGYYKANISFTVQKIEMAMDNAKQFEQNGNKGKAKKVYEEVKPLFPELAFAQSLLIAIGSDEESTQIEKSLALKSELTMAVSRLQSAIIVYTKSEETNFGQTVRLLEPKLKAELSKRGCSFTPNPEKADWVLNIKASTRKGREMDGIFFSFLDADISLVEQRTGKEIYNNNFTDLKGGGLDYPTAGRKAYDSGLQTITEEIIKSIEK